MEKGGGHLKLVASRCYRIHICAAVRLQWETGKEQKKYVLSRHHTLGCLLI